MLYLFVQTFLKFREEHLAFLLLQTIGSYLYDKIFRSQHAIVQHGQDHRIHDDWPEFFHEIERQRWTPVKGAVQVANKVIEAHQLHRAGHLVGQERISETEQCIDRIGWWTLHSSRKRPLPGPSMPRIASRGVPAIRLSPLDSLWRTRAESNGSAAS